MRMFMLAYCGALIRFYYTYLWRPKPESLEQILDVFSKNQDEVFFIQVGSNDGFQHDPLCKFIKRDGWKGLLMEPQKSAFDSLAYIYQNDTVTPINKAVDKIDQQRKLFKIAFSEARWATGLSSFNEEQLLAMIESGHIARKCEKFGVPLPEHKDQYIKYDLIDCVTFERLIQQHQIQQIDLIHIDTEGYDFEILKLFPFSSFQPKIVIFEHSHLSLGDLQEAQQHLESKGYYLQQFGADTLGRLRLVLPALAS